MTQESNRAASRAGWNLWQWQPPLLGWQVQQHTGDTDIHYRPQVFIVVALFGQWGAANSPEYCESSPGRHYFPKPFA